jgi:hypothetical protein
MICVVDGIMLGILRKEARSNLNRFTVFRSHCNSDVIFKI